MTAFGSFSELQFLNFWLQTKFAADGSLKVDQKPLKSSKF